MDQVVARMRGAGTLPGMNLLDRLFRDLLTRGSRNVGNDAKRLLDELDADPELERAVREEYAVAYATAAAHVRFIGNVKAQPLHAFWAAADEAQWALIRIFASVLMHAMKPGGPLASVTLPSLHGLGSPAEAKRLKNHANKGALLAIDHDVIWGHSSSKAAEWEMVKQGQRARSSVQTMRRRHRLSTPSLGIHSRASRSAAGKWLKKVRRTLWWERLRPLHPALAPGGAKFAQRVRALDLAQRRGRPERVVRKTLAAPKDRASVEALLPDAVWNEVVARMPSSENPARVRRTVLGVIAVLDSGITFPDLPQEFGLGAGKNVLERVETLRKHGAWSSIEAVLGARMPHLDFGRLVPRGPPRPRRRRTPPTR